MPHKVRAPHLFLPMSSEAPPRERGGGPTFATARAPPSIAPRPSWVVRVVEVARRRSPAPSEHGALGHFACGTAGGEGVAPQAVLSLDRRRQRPDGTPASIG